MKGGHNYYYNLQTKEGTWVEPEAFEPNNMQINKEEIQVGLCQVWASPEVGSLV